MQSGGGDCGLVGDTRPVSMEMAREQKGQKPGRLLGEKPLPGPKVTPDKSRSQTQKGDLGQEV